MSVKISQCFNEEMNERQAYLNVTYEQSRNKTVRKLYNHGYSIQIKAASTHLDFQLIGGPLDGAVGESHVVQFHLVLDGNRGRLGHTGNVCKTLL